MEYNSTHLLNAKTRIHRSYWDHFTDIHQSYWDHLTDTPVLSPNLNGQGTKISLSVSIAVIGFLLINITVHGRDKCCSQYSKTHSESSVECPASKGEATCSYVYVSRGEGFCGAFIKETACWWKVSVAFSMFPFIVSSIKYMHEKLQSSMVKPICSCYISMIK